MEQIFIGGGGVKLQEKYIQTSPTDVLRNLSKFVLS